MPPPDPALLAAWLAVLPHPPERAAAICGLSADAIAGLVGAAGGLGGFFPPILLGLVRDATGEYAIGFMLLSEFALLCLIVNLLVVERRAEQLAGEE